MLMWYVHEVIHDAFKIFDVDAGGTIDPHELAHMMFLLGEELSLTELGHMIAECKVWGQPVCERPVTRRSGRTHSVAGGDELQNTLHGPRFQPQPVPETVDLEREKIDEPAFRVMLTEYWTKRKYGNQELGSVVSHFQARSRHRREKGALKDYSLHKVKVDEASAKTDFHEVVLPTPSWMSDIAVDHKELKKENRSPQMFWYYLVKYPYPTPCPTVYSHHVV